MSLLASPVTADLPARQRVLLTACRLFYQDGIRATGIDRVIAESGVTKVTFYRHFASKNDLVCAYLQHRHERWMAWFNDALARHASAGGLATLSAVLPEWLRDDGFRGCAFLNSVSELGETLPQVVRIARQHKTEMTAAIEALLPASPARANRAGPVRGNARRRTDQLGPDCEGLGSCRGCWRLEGPGTVRGRSIGLHPLV